MSEEIHCRDCCRAQSWAALGITGYTGKSIPEHIAEICKERDMLRERLTFQDRWLSGGIYYTNGEITQLYEDHRRELEFMYKKGQMGMRERAAKAVQLGCPTSEEEAAKRYGANWRSESILSLPIEPVNSGIHADEHTANALGAARRISCQPIKVTVPREKRLPIERSVTVKAVVGGKGCPDDALPEGDVAEHELGYPFEDYPETHGKTGTLTFTWQEEP